MLKRIKKLRPLKQALFALLIGTAVVAFWRGVWGIMDIYLFPKDPAMSFLISILFGLAVLAFTHYLTKELA